MNQEEVTDLRDELIRCASRKEIKYTEKYIKKASQGALEKIKHDYDIGLADVVNTQLTEMFIDKFSELMKQLNVVENNSDLNKELTDNKLFCKDIKSIVMKITPFIPLIGLLTGGLILVKHAWNEKTTTNKNHVQNDEAGSSNGGGDTVNSNNDRADIT